MGDKFEQEFSACFTERHKAQLIDDQEANVGELTLMIVAFVLLQIDAARDYFGRYPEGQVFSSLAGERGETGCRLKSLRALARMLVYPLLL